MVRALEVSIIVAIVVLFTGANSLAQPNDFNQSGEGSGEMSLEVYRQEQRDMQLQMQRQQLETERQQLQMQRQQIEMERQQLEIQRQQLQMEIDKQRH